MPRYKIRTEPSAYINTNAQNYLTENVGCILEIDLIEMMKPSSDLNIFRRIYPAVDFEMSELLCLLPHEFYVKTK